MDTTLPAPAPDAGTARAVLTFTRGTEIFAYNGANARKGSLEIKGQTFVAMERMDGYVRLRPGTYNATVEFKGNPANGSKAIFVHHDQKNSAGKVAGIFIHAARYPHHLEGCIAPGRSSDANGLLQSAEAMDDILKLIAGGWVRWTKLQLVVVDGSPAI